MKEHNYKTGKHGEEIAEDYLIDNGYKIVIRNYRCRFGEIDIIAAKENTLIFVEVKTRSHQRYGLPRESVTYAKQKVIIKTAQQYIQRFKIKDKLFRFDVIEVYYDKQPIKVVHIDNAFSL